MDYQLQVITLSVSDVDQAAAFYTQQAGFTLDVDYQPTPDFRVVQLTPPGSGLLHPDRCRSHRGTPRISSHHLPDRHRHRSRPPRTHYTRRQDQRHPAQVTDRQLERRLAARY
jgi:catechol 2,3-dioxygenase-like lactoylglutathione lyase family enzyme